MSLLDDIEDYALDDDAAELALAALGVRHCEAQGGYPNGWGFLAEALATYLQRRTGELTEALGKDTELGPDGAAYYARDIAVLAGLVRGCAERLAELKGAK